MDTFTEKQIEMTKKELFKYDLIPVQVRSENPYYWNGYEETCRIIAEKLPSLLSQVIQNTREDTVDKVLDVLISEGDLKGKELIAHDTSKKSHGSCCYCLTCGHDNDYCVCSHNRLLTALNDQTLSGNK